MASILKKFNSIGGFSVGDETPIDVIDAIIGIIYS